MSNVPCLNIIVVVELIQVLCTSKVTFDMCTNIVLLQNMWDLSANFRLTLRPMVDTFDLKIDEK